MTESPSLSRAASAPPDPAVEARRAQQRTRTDALRADFRHDLDVAFGDYPRQVMDAY